MARQTLTLVVFSGTLALDLDSVRHDSERAVPGPGRGRHPSHQRRRQLGVVHRHGGAADGGWPRPSSRTPMSRGLTSYVGIDGTNTTLNNGRFLINLKSRDDRSDSAEVIARRLQGEVADISGISPVSAARTGLDPRHHGVAEPVPIRVARSESTGVPAIRAGADRAHEKDRLDHRRHQRPQQRWAERQRRSRTGNSAARTEVSGSHGRQCAVRHAGTAHRVDHLRSVQPVSRDLGGEAGKPADHRIAGQLVPAEPDQQHRPGPAERHCPPSRSPSRRWSSLPGAVSRGDHIVQFGGGCVAQQSGR